VKDALAAIAQQQEMYRGVKTAVQPVMLLQDNLEAVKEVQCRGNVCRRMYARDMHAEECMQGYVCGGMYAMDMYAGNVCRRMYAGECIQGICMQGNARRDMYAWDM
jgi:ribosomal protein L40E